MKALILSCNTGQGHNSVSTAVTEAFGKRGVPAETADALAFVSEWASKAVCEWHTRLYRHFPKASGNGYSFLEQHPELFDDRSPIHKLIKLGVDKLYTFIAGGEFEIVICPHVISALMITELMREYPEVKLRTAFIATDYNCAPMTEESDLDFYFIPTDTLIHDYVKIGIAPEKIVCNDGMPVRSVFYSCKGKPEAKHELGLPEDCRHAVMMFGSMGCGPIPKLTGLISKSLPENGVVSVVCGTNEAVYKRLMKDFGKTPNVRVYGFVKNISTLMDSADLFITKPGGLSTAEAAVKRLPMLLDNAVSGCEQYNLEYFLSIGAAVTAEGNENIAGLCVSLLKDDEQLAKMRAKLHKRKNAAEQIADAILEGYEPTGAPAKIENDFVYWRKRCRLTQNELSKILGIPRRTLSSWETKESSPPPYIKRLVIAELKRMEKRMNAQNGGTE